MATKNGDPPSFQYDVALSFAGEDREIVESIARQLVDCDVKVFYDEFVTHELWGKDLFQHLSTVYRDKAKYCLVFVSKAYKEKVWPKHEFGEKAVLCGKCGVELTISQYLDCDSVCPRCGARFNPRCRLHLPQYFDS